MAAYLIFTHRVTDADKLNNDYLPKAVDTLGPYGPEICIVDENIEVIEGDSGHTRTVMLKFKDQDQAKTWYNSPEYQAVVNLRMDSIDGAHAVLCDSFEAPGA